MATIHPPLTAPAAVHQTGNGADRDVGLRWLRKSFHVAAPPGATGHLYIVVGVWSTWETPRIYYYLDDLTVQLTPE